MKRGDIFWVNLEPAIGSEIKKSRPCVLVGATPINQVRRTLIVVPLSSSPNERPPLTVRVTCLGKQVIAVCDQIKAIDKKRLMKPAGKLSTTELHTLDEALKQVLALS
jgi:mRNA interferase MazF